MTRRIMLVIILVLAIGEVATRVKAYVTRGGSQTRPENIESLYVPHPFVGYTPRPGFRSHPGRATTITINSLGFRGAEIDRVPSPGTYRIACLGGSTTFGTSVSDDTNPWPAVLQRLLNAELPDASGVERVEVINAGASGYTLMESFVNLKMRVLPLQPDLIIIYHAANDARAIRRGRFQPDYTHVRRSWTQPEAAPLDFILGWSRLYRAFVPDRTRGPLHKWLNVDDFDELPGLSVDNVGPGLQTVRWTLREIVSLSRLHGARVLLCTFTWQHNEENNAIRYIGVVRRINEVIREVTEQFRIPLADVNANGPKRPDLFSDIVHFTDEGHALVARVVADTVLTSGLLNPRERR